MAKRLQVIIQDPVYKEIQRIARSRHQTIAQWVRQALDMARRMEPMGDVGKKLDIVRAAVKNSYPTGDIAQMLAEIEQGYSHAAQT